jgi:hypothetical protein
MQRRRLYCFGAATYLSQACMYTNIPLTFLDVAGIEWNIHKMYGPIMFPHLTANWAQIWKSAMVSGQTAYVFRKRAH